MQQALTSILLTLLEGLRRLWQRLTGQTPRPIPIPVRSRWTASSLRTDLANLRAPDRIERLRIRR